MSGRMNKNKDISLSNVDNSISPVDDTTTTTEVVGSSLPSIGVISIISCVLSALIFTRRNHTQ